jgi:hypothetical protein
MNWEVVGGSSRGPNEVLFLKLFKGTEKKDEKHGCSKGDSKRTPLVYSSEVFLLE